MTNPRFTTIRGDGMDDSIPPHGDNEQAMNLFSDYVVPVSPRVPIAQRSTVPRPDPSRCRSLLLPLAPGDLVIVDSGRHYDRVTPVEGGATCWTARSFISHAIDRRAVYSWS
jgi:hypothetical protein